MLCANFYRALLRELSMFRSHDSFFQNVNKFKFARVLCIIISFRLFRLLDIEIMITFKLVTFKRSLTNIIIAINNEVVLKKRKVKNLIENSIDIVIVRRRREKSFINFTKNSFDIAIVSRRREKLSKTKIKSRESRVDSHAFLDSTRFSLLVIFFSRRFIRRAQMKTTRRLLFELNVELRALHETSL